MKKTLPVLLLTIAIGCRSHWARPHLQESEVVSVSQENSVGECVGEHSEDVNGGQDKLAKKEPQPNASQTSTETADKEKMRAQAIGLSVSRARRLAKSHGKDFRVVKINGKNLVVTMDLRTERLSVAVQYGKVVSAEWR